MQTKSTHIQSQRVALFGGAFDPIHNAHLEVARRALAQASLDEVVLIPAAQSPLKAHAPHVGDNDRLRMLDLAIAGERHFRVDSYEINKGGISYSVDTARYFQASHPDAQLHWIIGADQFEQLAEWKQIEDLAAMVRFLVVARPGYQMQQPEVPGLVHTRIDAPLMSVSSSEIRKRCAEGRSIVSLVPPTVEAFILAHRLYSCS